MVTRVSTKDYDVVLMLEADVENEGHVRAGFHAFIKRMSQECGAPVFGEALSPLIFTTNADQAQTCEFA